MLKLHGRKPMYRTRLMESNVQQYLTIFPIVGIIGPRQSGKSTLLKHQLGKTYRYVTFDDRTQVDFFYEDPQQFLNQYDHHVIFDEAQKVPELFDALKIKVDENRDQYGKFVLTGSSQFSFTQSISESLAGRMGLLTLLPFSYLELPIQWRLPRTC